MLQQFIEKIHELIEDQDLLCVDFDLTHEGITYNVFGMIEIEHTGSIVETRDERDDQREYRITSSQLTVSKVLEDDSEEIEELSRELNNQIID